MKFHVGQRVRVVSVFAGHESLQLVGKEGAVNEIGAVNGCGDSGLVGVTIDGNSSWCFAGYQLEPILYDGNKVVEWSECLWRPERQGAHA
jgi:hypothetical protein